MGKRDGGVAPHRDADGTPWYAWDPGWGVGVTHFCAGCQARVDESRDYVCVSRPSERRRDYLCYDCWYFTVKSAVAFNSADVIAIQLPLQSQS